MTGLDWLIVAGIILFVLGVVVPWLLWPKHKGWVPPIQKDQEWRL